MNSVRKKDYLLTWVEKLRSKGRFFFTLEEARNSFDVSRKALQLTLGRLSKEGKIKSLVRGFYLYLPPEHRKAGILPVDMFVDDLMMFFKHRYYLALLSAASIHGAAHHAPQRVFILTELPPIRPIIKDNLYIQFIHTRDFPETGIVQKKTQTGYIQVSGPELTAFDLVKFEKNVGGLQRATEVLEELQELIDPNRLLESAKQYPNTAVLQRLGFIFECILENKDLADMLEKSLAIRKTHYQVLSPAEDEEIHETNANWKIKVNTHLTAEF